MTSTRNFTAIALGISALSMTFMAVVLPGIASADVPWDDPNPAMSTAGISDDVPWDGPEPTTGNGTSDVPWDDPKPTPTSGADDSDVPWDTPAPAPQHQA